MRERRERLARLEQLRQSLGHASVLARGFALVRDEDNRLVRAAAAVAAGQRLRLQFADGEIAAKALGGDEPLAGTSRREASRRRPKNPAPRPRANARTTIRDRCFGE